MNVSLCEGERELRVLRPRELMEIESVVIPTVELEDGMKDTDTKGGRLVMVIAMKMEMKMVMVSMSDRPLIRI